MKNHEGNSTRPNYFCVKMEKRRRFMVYSNEQQSRKIDNYLKIYIPEVIPKYKNVNNYAYKNIMLNVMEKTKEYKDLYKAELVFVFIKVVENQKNIDIDNKFVKPIIDGLVLSKVDEQVKNQSFNTSYRNCNRFQK